MCQKKCTFMLAKRKEIYNMVSMKKQYEDENIDALLKEFNIETDDNENVEIATMDEIEELEIFNQ